MPGPATLYPAGCGVVGGAMRVRRAARFGAVITAVATLVGLAGGGGQSAASVPEDAPVSWVERVGDTNGPAPELAAARASGRRVEVLAERTGTGQLFANPDGTFTSEEKPVPVRVRRGESWVPVDTTLQRRPDGTVRPAAVPVSLVFSGGGDGPLVRLGEAGRELALTWPTALPDPVLSGDTAVYRDVLPDVDLRLRASAQGFSEVLVVKTRAAADHPDLATLRFGLATDGLAVRVDEAGNLGAYDSAGERVFGSGPAFMWDSSTPTEPGAAAVAGPDQPGGRVAVAAVAVGAEHLSLRPDRRLLTDPGTNYPVYIDPDFGGVRSGWTLVLEGVSEPKWNGANDEPIGKSGWSDWESPIVKYRTYFQFDTARALGTSVKGAEFNALEIWAPDCGQPRWVRAYGTHPVGPGTNWANQPFEHGGVTADLGAHNAAFGRPGCPARWLGWNATAAVAAAVANGWTSTAILLKADHEGDRNAWKKWEANGVNAPTLVVHYNSFPGPVTELSAEFKGCGVRPNEPYVNPLNPDDSPRGPTLRARVSDPDHGLVRAHFEWYAISGAKLGEVTTDPAESGALFAATVPSSVAAAHSRLRYRARGYDGVDFGPWSGGCEVAIDRIRPDQPPRVSSATYPENDIGGTVGWTGGFTFTANGVPDVAGFLYDLHSSPSQYIPANRLGGSATALVTPMDDRPLDLFVRSVDRAGNVSDMYRYHFTPGRGTPPVAHWRLDGVNETTVVDTRPQRHDGTIAIGPARWVAGRHDDALRLDGASGHVNTTGGQAVPTNKSFSVAAWVKVDRPSTTWQVAVSQDGNHTSGFYLQYASDVGRWSFNMMQADVDNAVTDRAIADGPAQIGVWTHLVGVFDQASHQLRLYVNGRLQSSVGSHTTVWDATGTVQLGRVKYNRGHQGYLHGSLDDVRLYNRVLTAEEVGLLMGTPVVEELFLPFEEGAGTTAVDVSGSHRSGQLGQGVGWATGPDGGGAVSLPGTGGIVSIGRPVVRTDQSFMVSAQVRVGAAGTAVQSAVSQDGTRSSGFRLGYAPATKGWTFSVSTADADNPTLITVDSSRLGFLAQPGQWAHLVGVYDAVAGQVRLYVNGEAAGSTAGRTVTNVDGALVLGRAKLAGAATALWNGAIDDVHVWTGVHDEEALATFTDPVTTRPSAYDGQLNRFVDHSGDNLTAAGRAPAGYHFQGPLGTFAPAGAEGTRMLYRCRLNGVDEFTSSDAACEGREVLGPLGRVFEVRPEGLPVQSIFRCVAGSNHFDSNDPDCEDVGTQEFRLGYTAAYVILMRHLSPSYPYDHVSTTTRVPGDHRAELRLGLMAMAPEPGTVPVWVCRDDGDSYISTDQACNGASVVGQMGGRIWTAPPPHLPSHQVFRCRTSWDELFESSDPDCEGQTVLGPLGYLATHL